jgi:hypothetical protein
MTGPGKTCYVDGRDCDCDAFDVCGDCPRDDYAHEEELFSEEDIDDLYAARLSMMEQD